MKPSAAQRSARLDLMESREVAERALLMVWPGRVCGWIVWRSHGPVSVFIHCLQPACHQYHANFMHGLHTVGKLCQDCHAITQAPVGGTAALSVACMHKLRVGLGQLLGNVGIQAARM